MEEFDSTGWVGNSETNKDRVRSLIQQGSKVAGGAVGAALGFFAAGPAGAAAFGAAGAAISEALTHIGADVSQRLLGPREKVRVGGVLAISAAKIRERLEAGDQLRSDSFFDERSDGRSDADEIAESIILKAQRKSEEKKIPYMGNLLANAAFHSWITIPLAQQLAKTAEGLTYRQLVILATIPRLQKSNVRQSSYRDHGNFGLPLMEVLYEINDLLRRELVAVEGVATLGITDIEPNKLIIQGLGTHLHNLMGLNTIPQQELQEIAEILK